MAFNDVYTMTKNEWIEEQCRNFEALQVPCWAVDYNYDYASNTRTLAYEQKRDTQKLIAPLAPGSKTLMFPNQIETFLMRNQSAEQYFADGKFQWFNGDYPMKSSDQTPAVQTDEKALQKPWFDLNALPSENKAVQTDEVQIISTLTNTETKDCWSKYIKDIVKDPESDKTDLISAMESVLTTLKVYEAKRKEASSAKAEASSSLQAVQDKLTSSQKHWVKMMMTYYKLAEEARRNNTCLTDSAESIQTRLQLLLRAPKDIHSLLDDMLGILDLQLAQVDEEVKKTNLMNLQREEVQRKILEEELYIKCVNEKTEVLKQEAERNSELAELLVDYSVDVGDLEEKIEIIAEDIRSLTVEFEERVSIVRCPTTGKTSVVLNSSISSDESEESTHEPLGSIVPSMTGSVSRSSVSSQESEGSEKSESYDSGGFEGDDKRVSPMANGELEEYESSESEYSEEYESSENEDSEEHESSESEYSEEYESSENEDSEEDESSESEYSEEYESSENEDCEEYESPEHEGSEEHESSGNKDSEEYESSENEDSEEYGSSENEGSEYESEPKLFEENEGVAHTKAPERETFASMTETTSISALTDPSEEVSFQNSNSAAPTGDTYTMVEATNDTKTPSDDAFQNSNSAASTGDTYTMIEATNDTKTPSDDEWDFCSDNDSDA